jgi:diguanylate cyclase (GGDEF)-like protein
MGHDVGDMLLVETGRRLKGLLRESDIVARIGGDEFTIMAVDVKRTEVAEMIAGKILETLSEPFMIGSRKIKISTSIGISMFPSDGNDVESMLKNADAAMYKAKGAGARQYTGSAQNPTVSPA